MSELGLLDVGLKVRSKGIEEEEECTVEGQGESRKGNKEVKDNETQRILGWTGVSRQAGEVTEVMVQ